jgi:arylsulfatase A-like enzyme
MKKNRLLRNVVLGAIAAIVAGLALFFLLPRPMPVKHVIFISLDTTRADHLGCYGNEWISTPNIDKLANDSLVLGNYMTVSTTTLPSHTSLFSGKYPINHGVPANGYMVHKQNRLLPEILKEKKFKTFGFIGAFPLSNWFDFAQGFDHYDEDFDMNLQDKKILHHQRRAENVTDSVIKYLENIETPKNLFLFVHYFDAHNPYQPPAPYDSMYRKKYRRKNNNDDSQTLLKVDGSEPTPKDRKKARNYAGEISYMDHHVGRLLDYLEKKEILKDSLIVVTSDHGENLFWEPNPFSHGWDTYQGVIKTLCIIRTPNTVKKGKYVKRLVANIDILPTVLEYLGMSVPDNIDGRAFSLEPGTEGQGIEDRLRFAESTKPEKIEKNPRVWRNVRNSHCAVKGNFKYIRTPYNKTEELYDLKLDPREKKNLVDSALPAITAIIDNLGKKLKRWINAVPRIKAHFQKDQTKETKERLRSLGYL